MEEEKEKEELEWIKVNLGPVILDEILEMEGRGLLNLFNDNDNIINNTIEIDDNNLNENSINAANLYVNGNTKEWFHLQQKERDDYNNEIISINEKSIIHRNKILLNAKEKVKIAFHEVKRINKLWICSQNYKIKCKEIYKQAQNVNNYLELDESNRKKAIRWAKLTKNEREIETIKSQISDDLKIKIIDEYKLIIKKLSKLAFDCEENAKNSKGGYLNKEFVTWTTASQNYDKSIITFKKTLEFSEIGDKEEEGSWKAIAELYEKEAGLRCDSAIQYKLGNDEKAQNFWHASCNTNSMGDCLEQINIIIAKKKLLTSIIDNADDEDDTSSDLSYEYFCDFDDDEYVDLFDCFKVLDDGIDSNDNVIKEFDTAYKQFAAATHSFSTGNGIEGKLLAQKARTTWQLANYLINREIRY
jgi:hypothetical protein